MASEGVQRDSQSLVNCSRKGARIEVDYKKRMLTITSREQRHNGLVITSKIGFCSSAATRMARARRPVESATLRIFNEGPRTGMDGMRKRIEGNKLEISSLLADSEFMANAAVFVIVCPPRSLTPKLTREAPETWSSLLKSWRPSIRVNRVGKLHNHFQVRIRPFINWLTPPPTIETKIDPHSTLILSHRAARRGHSWVRGPRWLAVWL